MNNTVIEIKELRKTYQIGEVAVHALQGVNLIVKKGEFLVIMGASGSGKSTLMNLIGCLDEPTSGDYYLDGKHVNSLTRNEYADIRNQKIGFVFQELNDQGITVILVTHEHDISQYAKRIVEMRDGIIVNDTLVENRRNAKEDLNNMLTEESAAPFDTRF